MQIPISRFDESCLNKNDQVVANHYYIMALQSILEIEKVKFEMGYSSQERYKINCFETVKKIYQEIEYIKSLTCEEIFILNINPDTIILNLMEVEFNCINQLLNMEEPLMSV